ncbi:rod shape-determining protein MreC [Hirschia baltica]|uniref:Cell shape-determining protein MreC n=1 Tax=Hirschia baltica (strain ATCC 49814 / DSM 5838 / IFAM 1418) TaxID=582402 RepID=C6XN14_HIRBI|nr:rod shape-determining protein MreC [Hirschia baltica]ACT58184.1 Rod shape-determining protein MreC [Hirschia baltica ATCC 49814]
MARHARHQVGAPRFAARAGIAGIAIALLGLLMVQSSSDVRRALQPARARMDGITSQLSSAANHHFAGYTWLFANKASKERIRELESQVHSLERWREASRTMSLRMVEYENMLDLMGEPQIGGVTARVIAETNGPFTHSRIANAGAVHGVFDGFAVVNEHGLLGRVVRTGHRTSRILLLTDYNSRIPVMGRTSLDRALLVGDKKVGARILHAETPDKIVEGEEWVTSGDDGLFERGLRVGFAHQDKEGWRLDLAMQRDAIDFVRILPPPSFVTPEELMISDGKLLTPNTDENLTSQSFEEASNSEQGGTNVGGRP